MPIQFFIILGILSLIFGFAFAIGVVEMFRTHEQIEVNGRARLIKRE